MTIQMPETTPSVLRSLYIGRFSRIFLASLVVVLLAACDRPRLGADFCPQGEAPPRNTILLLDTSDPLTAEHREVFRRLVREMTQSPSGDGDSSEFYVAEGEALIVYELSDDLDQLEPFVSICNPGGNPRDWTWIRDLFEGRVIARRRWEQFIGSLEQLLEDLFTDAESASASQSPIIESLGVIVPRHAPSRRTASANARTHLIIYSDLLQHTDALSHYGPYPLAEELRSNVNLQHLLTDLAGVDVSLYRLERAQYGRWQSADHYYWWTSFVDVLDGYLIHQESI